VPELVGGEMADKARYGNAEGINDKLVLISRKDMSYGQRNEIGAAL